MKFWQHRWLEKRRTEMNERPEQEPEPEPKRKREPLTFLRAVDGVEIYFDGTERPQDPVQRRIEDAKHL